MTVKELICKLQELPKDDEDLEVVVGWGMEICDLVKKSDEPFFLGGVVKDVIFIFKERV